MAAFRATLERPQTPGGDDRAQALIAGGMRRVDGEKLREHLIARTRFFDEQVLRALDARIPQVVILGAGYDDRALRFRAPGVRYFELDQPQTQADKRRRLERVAGGLSAVVLVAADFRSDDTAAALARAGHEATVPTLFLCEGLLIYLDEQTNERLLGALAARATGASRLAVSLAVHRGGEDSASVTAAANRRRRNAAREPWLTIRSPEDQIALLARAGWTVCERSYPVIGMLCAVARPGDRVGETGGG